jgi:hypothetical protein
VRKPGKANDGLALFSKRMEVMALKVDKGMTRIYREAFLAVDRAVVMKTPVDTGRARANWLPSITKPNTKARPNTFAAKASLDDGVRVAKDLQHRNRAFITNNIHYVVWLNDPGTSRQAPKGWVGEYSRMGLRSIRDARILGAPRRG